MEHSRKSLVEVVLNVSMYTLNHVGCYNKLHVYYCVLAMLMAFQILDHCQGSCSALQQTLPGLCPGAYTCAGSATLVLNKK